VTGRRGRRRKNLVGDLKEQKRALEELDCVYEELEFRGEHGPVAR